MRSPSTPKPTKVTVTFHAALAPRITDGHYKIRVTASLKEGGNRLDDPKYLPDSLEQAIKVDGPRFRIQPDWVHLAYPPPASAGVYDDVLPHITLEREALPWERKLDGVAGPWVALLVFAEDELRDDLRCEGKTQTMTVRTFATTAASRPKLKDQPDDEEKKTRLQYIQVTAARFRALVPRKAELSLLAHTRVIKPGEGETGKKAQFTPGHYAVVVGNRLPRSTGGRYVAHLVSLEGWEDYLGDSHSMDGKPPDSGELLQVASLWSWSFESLPDAGAGFDALTAYLFNPPKVTDLWLCPPTGGAPAGTSGEVPSLPRGYVPLTLRTETGKSTFGWYRGPAAPVPAGIGRAKLSSPVEALQLVPVHGVFDTSRAAAWNLGRGLALADPSFCQALLRLRGKARNLLHTTAPLKLETAVAGFKRLVAGHAALFDKLYSTPSAALGPDEQPHSALPDITGAAYGVSSDSADSPAAAGLDAPESPLTLKHPDDQVPAKEPERPHQDWQKQGRPWDKDAKARRRPPTSSTPGQQPRAVSTLTVEKVRDDAELNEQLYTALTALHTGKPPVPQGESLASAAAPVADERPQAGEKPDDDYTVVRDWLRRRWYLEGVPFHHIVPDMRALPAESMRFFYVDPYWVDAMVRGALSVGMAHELDGVVSEVLFGPADVTRPSDYPKAGFVIRSRLVSGWPSLGITALKDGNRLSVHRDRRGKEVLLALIDDIPDKVSLAEPHQAVHFGIDHPANPTSEELAKPLLDRAIIRLRSLKAGEVGKDLIGIKHPKDKNGLTDYVRTASPAPDNVLNIALLAADLGKRRADINSSGTDALEPTEFAIQMLNAPNERALNSR